MNDVYYWFFCSATFHQRHHPDASDSVHGAFRFASSSSPIRMPLTVEAIPCAHPPRSTLSTIIAPRIWSKRQGTATSANPNPATYSPIAPT